MADGQTSGHGVCSGKAQWRNEREVGQSNKFQVRSEPPMAVTVEKASISHTKEGMYHMLVTYPMEPTGQAMRYPAWIKLIGTGVDDG